MAKFTEKTALSRRDLLVVTVSLLGAAALPRQAWAGADEADAMLKKLTGGAAAQSGKITLKLPEIAENGGSVPMTVSVDSPMTEKDYCKSIHLVSEGNPLPGLCSYHFTPGRSKAEAQLRIRMAKTQKVRAVAVMSDGSVYETAAEIKVTIGGC